MCHCVINPFEGVDGGDVGGGGDVPADNGDGGSGGGGASWSQAIFFWSYLMLLWNTLARVASVGQLIYILMTAVSEINISMYNNGIDQ